MKKFLSLLLTGAMSAMLLAGCGNTANDSSPASSSTPSAGAEERSITIAQSANFSMGFAPGVQSYEATYYMNNFYEGLVEYRDGEYLPCLATDWVSSDDGLTYTFTIREGVVWVDSQGRQVAELTADDWVAGLQHVADAGSSAIYNLTGILEGLDAYIYGETTDFSTVGVKALDDHPLQYTLVEECPYFMSMISDACFTPMSRSYYLSQGGVFGIAEYDSAMASSSYLYGTDQDHIAYCGPYLCTNVTDKNSINYVDDFALATWGPLSKDKQHRLQLFVDKCSIEIFLDGGKVAMTNLVFPNEPYNSLSFYSRNGSTKVNACKLYALGL